MSRAPKMQASRDSAPARRDGGATRRDVLAWTLAAGAVALVGPRLPFAIAKDSPKDKRDDSPIPGRGAAKQMIVLYMAGGATQFETWAPKKKGSPNMGEAEPINTSVPGVEIGSYLPKTAKAMDDVCVVRSVTTREGNHDRGRYLMHTGYIPNPTVKHPGLGSYVAREIGNSDSVLPNFVSIGGSQGAGYLGVEWDPFTINNAAAPVDNLMAPAGIDARRRNTRLSLLDRLNREFESDRGDEAVAPHRNMFDRAKRLMDTAKNRAFDVSEEPDSISKLYGESSFGKGCIVARRLLEAAMVANLAEFGRTPRINPAGGRDHWPQCWSVYFAGGGVKGGRVIGATDPDGVTCIERPVMVQELHATVCHSLGIDQDKQFYAGKRPMRIVDQLEGKRYTPVRELFV